MVTLYKIKNRISKEITYMVKEENSYYVKNYHVYNSDMTFQELTPNEVDECYETIEVKENVNMKKLFEQAFNK
jgi:hypothetical protein